VKTILFSKFVHDGSSRDAVEQLRATLELSVVIKVWIKAKLVPLIIV